MCTPNLHLHCHLSACLADFGPAHVFWLFGCERLNGVLGSVPTNQCDIEMQLMRKFSTNQQVLRILESNHEIKTILNKTSTIKGTLKCPFNPEEQKIYKLLPTIKEGYLSTYSLSMLDNLMRERYGEQYNKTYIIHKYSKALHINNMLVGSKDSLHSSSSMVLVKNDDEKVPAIIKDCLLIKVMLQESVEEKFVVTIHWLDEHPHKH